MAWSRVLVRLGVHACCQSAAAQRPCSALCWCRAWSRVLVGLGLDAAALPQRAARAACAAGPRAWPGETQGRNGVEVKFALGKALKVIVYYVLCRTALQRRA